MKLGHPDALDLLGFSSAPEVAVADLVVVPRSAAVGSSVQLEFVVVATGSQTQTLMIDYAVRFQNVSGRGSRKVFKGKVVDLDPGMTTRMSRKVSLQQMTTRRIVPGRHSVEVQVNGVVHASVGFDVTG